MMKTAPVMGEFTKPLALEVARADAAREPRGSVSGIAISVEDLLASITSEADVAHAVELIDEVVPEEQLAEFVAALAEHGEERALPLVTRMIATGGRSERNRAAREQSIRAGLDELDQWIADQFEQGLGAFSQRVLVIVDHADGFVECVHQCIYERFDRPGAFAIYRHLVFRHLHPRDTALIVFTPG